jgi:Zn-dependent protease with chaperone function
MDFFAREEGAERASRRLALLFALAVLATVVTINLVTAYALDVYLGHQDLVVAVAAGRHHHGVAASSPTSADQAQLLRFETHAGVTLATLAIIALGSIWKISQLSAGGAVVASMLGGRLVGRTPSEAKERTLVNIVQEMSIASGVPMPEVFVLDHEQGINAFAAGHQPGDAAVTVTRGALDQLSRDELQGVIGHEFSHILHGDMRLNLRLMGLVHGILVIGLTGALLIRFGSTARSSSSSSKGNPLAALVVVGIAAYIIGYIGFFFGGLIKSAISRQREYLADASSVQFTRNPQGLAGALKRLGAGYDAARIAHANAHEVSHFFFGNAVRASWLGMLETHPPLEDRIRAIDPQWDGSFPAPTLPERSLSGDAAPAPAPYQHTQAAAFGPQELVARIGTVSPEHVAFGALLLASIPGELQQAAKEPYTARALALCLLLDGERQRDQAALAAIAASDRALAQDVARLLPAVAARGAPAHLPILDLCLPSLRQLSASQRQDLLELVGRLQSGSGGRMGAYCIATLLRTRLADPLQSATGSGTIQSVQPLWPKLHVLLSALARAGVADGAGAPGGDEQEALLALRAAASRLIPDGGTSALLSAQECGAGALDAALSAIGQAAPGVKRRIVTACAWCVAADGVVTVAEAELLRVVCSCLGCPMPPFATPA